MKGNRWKQLFNINTICKQRNIYDLATDIFYEFLKEIYNNDLINFVTVFHWILSKEIDSFY